MVEVYAQELPESSLLVLRNVAQSGREIALAQALDHARHAAKPAVWVDCSLLRHPSEEVLELLLSYTNVLDQLGTPLILTHVPEDVRHQLEHTPAPAAPCIVPTLLDAAAHRTTFHCAAPPRP